jgi:hypothetical protein
MGAKIPRGPTGVVVPQPHLPVADDLPARSTGKDQSPIIGWDRITMHAKSDKGRSDVPVLVSASPTAPWLSQ